MTVMTFETVVAADHQLHLPANLPVGCRLRVTVEPLDPVSGNSELGKTLREIRQRAIAKGMKLQTPDDILDEIRQDRGETSHD